MPKKDDEADERSEGHLSMTQAWNVHPHLSVPSANGQLVSLHLPSVQEAL